MLMVFSFRPAYRRDRTMKFVRPYFSAFAVTAECAIARFAYDQCNSSPTLRISISTGLAFTRTSRYQETKPEPHRRERLLPPLGEGGDGGGAQKQTASCWPSPQPPAGEGATTLLRERRTPTGAWDAHESTHCTLTRVRLVRIEAPTRHGQQVVDEARHLRADALHQQRVVGFSNHDDCSLTATRHMLGTARQCGVNERAESGFGLTYRPARIVHAECPDAFDAKPQAHPIRVCSPAPGRPAPSPPPT